MSESINDPRRVVEKAVWRYGVPGDSWAHRAAMILDDLRAAGLAIVPAASQAPSA